MRKLAAAAICAAMAVAGCKIQSADFDAGFDTETLQAMQSRIKEVARLELGRTRTGLALTAFGATQGGGWSYPELRRTGVSADGVMEFDFVAIPPQEAAAGTAAMRADVTLTQHELAGITGFRVTARESSARISFSR